MNDQERSVSAPNPAAAATFDAAFWEARAQEQYAKLSLTELRRKERHCRRTLRRALPVETHARILIFLGVALEWIAKRSRKEPV